MLRGWRELREEWCLLEEFRLPESRHLQRCRWLYGTGGRVGEDFNVIKVGVIIVVMCGLRPVRDERKFSPV